MIPLKAPCNGFVCSISAVLNEEIAERSFVWMNIVEQSERFTNLDEYRAKFSPDTDYNEPEENWVILGRSTHPLIQDTDGDGLIDGIEVMGWTIRVVQRGVNEIDVYSDPNMFDTDGDGLNDSREYC